MYSYSLQFIKVIRKVLLPNVLYIVMFLCIYVGKKTKLNTKTPKHPNPNLDSIHSLIKNLPAHNLTFIQHSDALQYKILCSKNKTIFKQENNPPFFKNLALAKTKKI